MVSGIVGKRLVEDLTESGGLVLTIHMDPLAHSDGQAPIAFLHRQLFLGLLANGKSKFFSNLY